MLRLELLGLCCLIRVPPPDRRGNIFDADRYTSNAICRGKKAQKVAANFANGLRKVCKEVKLKGGAAARG